MDASINIGARVYLKIAIAGDPGIVVGFDRKGKAAVDWYDIGIRTHHDPESLIVDEAFVVRQLSLFEEVAA
jgi:hypothetical protein